MLFVLKSTTGILFLHDFICFWHNNYYQPALFVLLLLSSHNMSSVLSSLLDLTELFPQLFKFLCTTHRVITRTIPSLALGVRYVLTPVFTVCAAGVCSVEHQTTGLSHIHCLGASRHKQWHMI